MHRLVLFFGGLFASLVVAAIGTLIRGIVNFRNRSRRKLGHSPDLYEDDSCNLWSWPMSFMWMVSCCIICCCSLSAILGIVMSSQSCGQIHSETMEQQQHLSAIRETYEPLPQLSVSDVSPLYSLPGSTTQFQTAEQFRETYEPLPQLSVSDVSPLYSLPGSTTTPFQTAETYQTAATEYLSLPGSTGGSTAGSTYFGSPVSTATEFLSLPETRFDSPFPEPFITPGSTASCPPPPRS